MRENSKICPILTAPYLNENTEWWCSEKDCAWYYASKDENSGCAIVMLVKVLDTISRKISKGAKKE